MGGAGDVGVGQDRQELRRGAPQDSGRVDVADGSGERRGHRLEGLVDGERAVGFDQQHAEVALVAVSPRELILQDRPHEAIVEESGGPVDDVQRLCLGIVRTHAARRAEDGAVGKWRTARLTGLSLGPPA